MPANFRRQFVIFAVCLGVLFGFCLPVPAAEFTADVTVQSPYDSTEGKIYVKDSVYRFETTEDGKPVVYMVNQDSAVSRICHTADKIYYEVPSDDLKSIMKDPFQSLKYTLETPGTERKDLGKETINGIECTKQVVLWGGTPFYTYYTSEKYDFPIKFIRGEAEKTVELKNVEEKKIDDTFFRVPDGFALKKESEEKK
jgi:hypothetical protein